MRGEEERGRRRGRKVKLETFGEDLEEILGISKVLSPEKEKLPSDGLDSGIFVTSSYSKIPLGVTPK